MAGSTGLILALTAGVAEAITVTVPVNVTLSRSSAFGSVEWVSFNPASNLFVGSFDNSFYAKARNCSLSLSGSNGMEWSTAPISLGSTVDNSLTFTTSKFALVPADGDTVYHGYAFTPTSGTDTFYGYAQFTGLATGVSSSRDFIFDGYVFENTPGTAITVAAVPEPSMAATFIGLSVGAFALLRRRRR